MGRLSNAIAILLSLPDPPPDRDAALIDAVSLVISQSLLSTLGNAALAGAGAQEAAGDAAARLRTGLLERELITEAQSDALHARVVEHLAGRRAMSESMHHASEGKTAAVVCGVIGAVMATTSRDSNSLVETIEPFGAVEYRGSVQEQGNGKKASYSVAASNAPGSANKFGSLTTANGTGEPVTGNATYGVANGSQTLRYTSGEGSSSAKITFSEREDEAAPDTSGESIDSGVDDDAEVTSGVSVVVNGDETSYTSTVTDGEGNISIVSVTEFSGTGAWTLTITSVDSSGAGTSTIITGDGQGNVTEVTISNVEELGDVDTGENGTTGTGFEETEVGATFTEESVDTTVTEMTGAAAGEEDE